MSLMNEALRKKKREKKHPPATEIFQDGLKSKSKSPVKTYGIVTIAILVLALGGFYTWEYFSINTSQQSTFIQPIVTEKITEPETETIAVVQENPIPPTPKAEESKAIKSQKQPVSETLPKVETPPKKPTPKEPAAPEIVKPQPVVKQKPKLPAPEKEPSLSVIKTMSAQADDTRDEMQTVAQKPEPDEPDIAAIFQLDPVERLFFQKAVSYHRQNDLDTAIQMYQEVLQINPEHEPSRFNLSSAYLEIDAYAEAYPLLTTLHESKPDDPDILLNLAIAEIGMQKPDVALTLLDQAERHFTTPKFEVLLHKGVAYSSKNEYAEAVEWYQKAERLQARNPRLLLNKAIAYDHLQQYTDALAYYQMLLNQDESTLSQTETRMIEKRISILRKFTAQQATQTGQ